MRDITAEVFYRKLIETKDGEQYLDLIQSARTRENQEPLIDSFEVHHIFPISLGGSDFSSNKVKLTFYEHCLAHLFLAKCFSYPETYFVLNRMSGKKFLQLSDLERVTLDEVYLWSQTRELARKQIRGTRCSVCEPQTGKVVRILKEELNEYLDEGYRLGLTEARKKANRVRNLGKVFISNEQLGCNKMVPKGDLESYLKQGWTLGRLQSFKRSIKGKIPVNKDGQEKHVFQKELQKYLAEGWILGTSEKQRVNHGKTMKGRVRIYKGAEGLMVFPEEAEKYYKLGWKRGRSETYKKAVEGRVIVSKEGHFRRVSKEKAQEMIQTEGYVFGYCKKSRKLV